MHTTTLKIPAFLLCWVAGAATAGQRCDLVSRPEISRCLDLAKLDQTSLMVPASTTRIPTDALVLCGKPASVPEPTDIVYVVDQTLSMKPTAILIHGADTSGFYECNQNGNPTNPRVTYSGTRSYHGLTVDVIAPGFTEATIRSVCNVAGDPQSARSTAIQTALRTQAEKAPASFAATINFSKSIVSTQDSMTLLSNPVGLAGLLASIPNTWASGTSYENPLAWSRVLLYGGRSGATAIPASKNARKAVIFLSDGRPSSGWEKGLSARASVAYDGSTWTTDSTRIPPIYGIFLGLDDVEGSILDSLSKMTGGHYYQIPPNQPDSLGKVIQEILGELIPATTPDGMTVVNQTNGQSSVAVKTVVDGNSYRMQLDSIIALEPGSNQIVLTTRQSGTPVSARLEIVVSDLPNRPSALDTLLTTRCDAPSSLTVRPDVSGLAWAESRDRNLLLTLNTAPDQVGTLSLHASTNLTGDAETLSLPVDATRSIGVMGRFETNVAWQLPTVQGVVPGDRVLRSGIGWDTAVFTFAMPRDARDTASARIALRHPPDAPDSVVYFDADGDGALDRAVVHLKLAWKPGMELQLPWPDSSTWLDWADARLGLSGDSLVATFDVTPQSPNLTAPRGTLLAKWRAGAIWEWQDVPVVEHIAPVPLRARLTRGSVHDTLRTSPSEALGALPGAIDALMGRVSGGTGQNLSPVSALLDPATGDLQLVFPRQTVATQLVPGDSVRFLPAIADRDGNHPGAMSKAVQVVGTDPLPTDAVLSDTDGDGRADRVVVRLIAPLSVTDSMGFSWPDTTRTLHERRLPLAAARVDSNGLKLVFDIAPFAFGATSCPATGCQNLAWMSSARFGAEIRSGFALRDGVDPAPLQARYQYALVATDPDTLYVWVSEATIGTAAPWVALGRASFDAYGKPLTNRRTPIRIDSTRFALLVDSTDAIRTTDSLRIAAAGGLADVARNHPDRTAYWTSIEWSVPPPVIAIAIPHPVVKMQEAEVPAGEPALTVVLRDPATGAYSAPGAVLPHGLETRFGGPQLRLNRIPKRLGLYIYDNMGVAVLSKDLSQLADLSAAGLLQRDHRGQYEVWLAWDGKDAAGRPVSSGVYTFRVWGRFDIDGAVRVVNKTITEGVFRREPLP